jgi:hypothetical protein
MMDGTQITTAHLAVFIAAGGIVTSVGTALALFLLQRLFGSGDKAGAEIDELKDKVHALELSAERAQTNAREHVASNFATKDDIKRLERHLEGFATAQREYHETLQTILRPLADQLTVAAVRR